MSEIKGISSSKTLVEFYDSDYLENIISLLRCSYSGVVYAYFTHANEPTAHDRDALSEYIKNNFGFTPHFLEIAENTLDCALNAFRTLTNDGEMYDFDITGGSSVFIAAVGALVAGDGGKRLFLHEYDPASGKRIFSYPENISSEKNCPTPLAADYIFALKGIEILHPERSIRYQLNQDGLRNNILRLWEAIRGELRAWNSFCCISSNIERGYGCFYVDKQISSSQLKNCKKLLKNLSENGIISELREQMSGDILNISYRLSIPESALFLYDKGGSILEMITYMSAVDSGRFADCCVGISLDWDNADKYSAANPYNEIDTVLTYGHIPYFISCKTTNVTNDILYEIAVMARHYGGKYAIPVLVCTPHCNTHLCARAKEMGVVLIDNVASLNAHDFAKKLISSLCGK